MGGIYACNTGNDGSGSGSGRGRERDDGVAGPSHHSVAKGGPSRDSVKRNGKRKGKGTFFLWCTHCSALLFFFFPITFSVVSECGL